MNPAGVATFTIESNGKTIAISIGNDDRVKVQASEQGREGAIEVELLGNDAEQFKEMMLIVLDRTAFPCG